MLTKRVIACLDVADGQVVKGIRFKSLHTLGDPVTLATTYETDGADEIIFLDITATVEERAAVLQLVRKTAENLFIPLTLGGGIRSVSDAENALIAGADKICLNTAAVVDPALITECSRAFGAQSVVVSIDAAYNEDHWRVWTRGGRTPTDLDAVEWARECVARGAGELLVTSIDRDGTGSGYDVELTRQITDVVPVPVIASGGAGEPRHVREVLTEGGASAALLAGVLHRGEVSIMEVKAALKNAGLAVR